MLLLVLAGLAAAALAGFLAPLGWPFELFVHFRPQFAAYAAILATGLLLVRHLPAALLSLALAVALAWPLVARRQAEVTASRCEGPALEVLTANLSIVNRDPSRLIAWVHADPPDVLLLQEVTARWATDLEQLSDYPYRRVVPRSDTHGIAMLSRWPMSDVRVLDLVGDGLPLLVAEIDTGQGRFHAAAIHAQWPLTAGLMDRRDRTLQGLAHEVQTTPGHWIVGGDFNLTPHSPVFDRLLESSGLADTRPVHGWQPTWLPSFWPLSLNIDHVLASPGICVQSSAVGPPIGSDHRPVRASLRLPATA